jgi:hypothetical protein
VKRRRVKWLASAAGAMIEAVSRDWEDWRKAFEPSRRTPHARVG